MRQSGTIHSIQALRAIAASLVALFHTQQAFSAKVSQPLFAQENYLFGFGAVGVHIFFVISGFIMVLTTTASGQPYSATRFLKRRFLRIYPIYWLCALAYIGIHALLGIPYGLSAGEYVGALTLWPGDAPRIIGPAWTLSSELYFYLSFGLAMMLGFHRGLIVLTATFLLAIAVGAIIPNKGPILLLVTNTLLLEFLAGTGIGWLAKAGRLPSRMGPALTGLAVALFVIGIAFGYERLPTAMGWGVPSAILVLGLITWETHSGANSTVRRFGRLGDSSYVLYLIHILAITVAVQFSLWAPDIFRLAPPAAAVVVTTMAIVLAEVVHRGLEQPLLALLKPKRGPGWSRREQASAPPLSG